LDGCAEKLVTILVAPAGSGKTVALAAWAARVVRPVTWIGPTSVGGSGGALRAALRTNTDDRRIIIVDDAHLLPTDVWSEVEAWLTRQSSGGPSLLLAGRRDVPLPLVSLELMGELSLLRANVLRFDNDEARDLIRVHAPDVSERDTRALEERAAGWAAALVLGARALAVDGNSEGSGEALARTDRPILDYLLREVFSTLPSSVQNVLLCTAEMPTVQAEAARVATGDWHADEVLADLAADGLFVFEYDSPTDASQQVWHYHPLLVEALRRHIIADEHARASVREAHRRVVAYYAVHGPVSEAIRHAALGGLNDRLVPLLTEEGPGLLSAGQHELLDLALHAIPQQALEHQPALVALSALASAEQRDTEMAARLSRQAFAAAHHVQEPNGHRVAIDKIANSADQSLLADVALLQGWRFRLGWTDVRVVISDIREILGCSSPSSDCAVAPVHRPHSAPWPLTAARNVWLLNELTAAEIWGTELNFAAAHNKEALAGAKALGHNRLLAGALANRGLLQMSSWRVLDAATSARECLQLCERLTRPDPVVMARAMLMEAWQAAVELRMSDAQEGLVAVDQLGIATPTPLMEALSEVLRAHLSSASGDLNGIRERFEALSVAGEPLPPAAVGMLAVLRARWAIAAGSSADLRQQASVMQESGWSEAHDVFVAMGSGLDGDVPGAVNSLDLLLAGPLGVGDSALAAIAAAWRLRLLLAAGDKTAARRALYDVLDRIVPQRRLNIFTLLDIFDPAVQELLLRDAARALPHPITADLLEALARHRTFLRTAPSHFAVHSKPAHQTLTPAGHRSSAPAPLLSEREQQVLGQLALGRSYSDIARALYISQNTVKYHVIGLYRKLGVDRRAAALARARELRLID
jgi:ATP/maltotriose-dependent transcriptional regulator MalT